MGCEMISLDLFGDPIQKREQIIWQIRSQWVGKPLITVPVSIHIGIGVVPPKSFGKIKRLQAINQMLKPSGSFNFHDYLDIYIKILDNLVVSNKNQFFKTSIERFYSEKELTKLIIHPDFHESYA